MKQMEETFYYFCLFQNQSMSKVKRHSDAAISIWKSDDDIDDNANIGNINYDELLKTGSLTFTNSAFQII